ncbi:hypothetical protein HWV62_31225 [Athelia sp. TMB]|nr:hypothetical protein HWV62_31225 [Athelia sp. TMB]
MRDRTTRARQSYHPYAREDLQPVRGASGSLIKPNSRNHLDGEAEITGAQSVRWIPLAEREANGCHQDSTGLYFEGCQESYRASPSSHTTTPTPSPPIPELMYPLTRAHTPAPSADTARGDVAANPAGLSTSSAPDNAAGVGCSPTGPVLISDEVGTVVERELVPSSKEGHGNVTATPRADNLGKELTPLGANHDGQDRKSSGTDAKSAPMRKLYRVENDFGVVTKGLSMAPADVKPCGGTITVTVIQNILGEHSIALEIDHETGKVIHEGVKV